jgi:hypothetical protein
MTANSNRDDLCGIELLEYRGSARGVRLTPYGWLAILSIVAAAAVGAILVFAA